MVKLVHVCLIVLEVAFGEIELAFFTELGLIIPVHAEEMNETNCCLVAYRNMEFAFGLDFICEELNLLDSCKNSLAREHCLGLACHTSLYLSGIKLCHADADPVALPRNLNWFTEHLH